MGEEKLIKMADNFGMAILCFAMKVDEAIAEGNALAYFNKNIDGELRGYKALLLK